MRIVQSQSNLASASPAVPSVRDHEFPPLAFLAPGVVRPRALRSMYRPITPRRIQYDPSIIAPRLQPTATLPPLLLAKVSVKAMSTNTAFLRFAQACAFNVPGFILMRVSKQKMLTKEGSLHALGLGLLLWTTLGKGGYMLCISFLFIGSFLTRVGSARKEALGIAEKRGGARGPENLWGAAGVAAICAFFVALARTLQTQHPQLVAVSLLRGCEQCFRMAYCGAIAAKYADTTSSEIGKAYGSRTYLMTTFRRVDKGTEGGVSVEGTVAGIVAATGAALLSRQLGIIPGELIYLVGVTLAGAIANCVESIIGAEFQNRWHLSNEQVNFVNTLVGAVFSGLFCYFITVLT